MLSNYLQVLIKPAWKKPINTIEDMVEHDIIPFYDSSGLWLKESMVQSDDPYVKLLGERMILTKSWDEYDILGNSHSSF